MIMTTTISYTPLPEPLTYTEYRKFIDDKLEFCKNNFGIIGDLWNFKFARNTVSFTFTHHTDATLFKLRFE